jgi:hypothetical protein
MGTANAWAAFDARGRILRETLSESRRAAIVNWLYVYGGVQVLATYSDDYIESLWRKFATGPAPDASVAEVVVTWDEKELQ